MRKMIFACLCSLLMYSASFSGEWASSIGSCYEKGNKSIGAGMCLGYIGYYFSFDYGFHDAISCGITTGYNGFRKNQMWRYNYMPIIIRAAFHPFNLKMWADKIGIRHKMDLVVGLSSGTSIGWVNYRGDRPVIPPEPKIGGFFIREYVGLRFFPTDMFFIGTKVYPTDMLFFIGDNGAGIGLIKLGAGLKF